MTKRKQPKYTKLECKQFDCIQQLLREIDKPSNIHWKDLERILRKMNH